MSSQPPMCCDKAEEYSIALPHGHRRTCHWCPTCGSFRMSGQDFRSPTGPIELLAAARAVLVMFGLGEVRGHDPRVLVRLSYAKAIEGLDKAVEPWSKTEFWRKP